MLKKSDDNHSGQAHSIVNSSIGEMKISLINAILD